MEGKSVLKTRQEKMPNKGKQICEAHEEANKHVIKQKRVSQEDKCRIGSSVPSSIGLEYGGHTDLCKNMQASMQRCKEAKKAKQVAHSKQGKYINIAQSGEGCELVTPTPWGCISQVVTPKQTLEGTVVTTQAQAHGRHKARQSLNLKRLTCR